MFCGAVTAVPVVVKMFCVTETMLSIPQTVVFANEKIFLARNHFPGQREDGSGFETMVLSFRPWSLSSKRSFRLRDIISEPETIVFVIEKDLFRLRDHHLRAGDIVFVIEKIFFRLRDHHLKAGDMILVVPTMVFVVEKIFSGFETIISEPETIVFVIEKMFSGFETIFSKPETAVDVSGDHLLKLRNLGLDDQIYGLRRGAYTHV